ncbi:hypothetical protein [Acrocarpospora catenulata]|uniref:hypothetical protein n=1 Tax=Acrocarpospora catenulata TaxID=2836182 RepID=UPI001BDB4CF6|nr:hypothetical protein [Acrocarpospora catenulata]
MGHVVDVRLLKDGRNWLDRRLDRDGTPGLIVSRRRAPFLLGLHRDANGRLTGAFQHFTRLLYAHSRVVPWDLIESSDTGEIHLKATAEELSRE